MLVPGISVREKMPSNRVEANDSFSPWKRGQVSKSKARMAARVSVMKKTDFSSVTVSSNAVDENV